MKLSSPVCPTLTHIMHNDVYVSFKINNDYNDNGKNQQKMFDKYSKLSAGWTKSDFRER